MNLKMSSLSALSAGNNVSTKEHLHVQMFQEHCTTLRRNLEKAWDLTKSSLSAAALEASCMSLWKASGIAMRLNGFIERHNRKLQGNTEKKKEAKLLEDDVNRMESEGGPVAGAPVED